MVDRLALPLFWLGEWMVARDPASERAISRLFLAPGGLRVTGELSSGDEGDSESGFGVKNCLELRLA